MPELPDITVYVEALGARIIGQFVERVRVVSPFLVRTFSPPIRAIEGKRALTDPTLFDGIGNAYSDEILHRARLSPLKLTTRMKDEEIDRLRSAAVDTLTGWIDRLRAETGDRFPEKVTAFRPEMAVHGRYGQPCPACGTAVQRLVYAENESNYCPTCQTGGRLLADRALSRLLRADWPKTLDELEQRRSRGREASERVFSEVLPFPEA